MDTNLIKSIGQAIRSAVSASTKQVYYLFVPDTKLLDKLTITFELTNDSNTDTFDTKEVVKNYKLEVKINAPTIEKLGDHSIYIKKNVYALQTLTVGHVHLDDEDLNYDEELEVYTNYLRFNIQV